MRMYSGLRETTQTEGRDAGGCVRPAGASVCLELYMSKEKRGQAGATGAQRFHMEELSMPREEV